MSKLTFSKQINESILRKLSALENLNFEEFMKKDEYFELALSIAYLTLSKEKIIEKDINNPKRLERLTKRVYTKDIDQIFKNGFSKEMPTISNSDEEDNTWILDNIRDSIMHEALEIDEEVRRIISEQYEVTKKIINNKLIKCVGNANEKLSEDALRILRAVRFATILNFKLDKLWLEIPLNNEMVFIFYHLRFAFSWI